MHQPLEATLTALEENMEAIYPSNSKTSPTLHQKELSKSEANGEGLNIIREKIKAARLEKLMARQLANELNSTSAKQPADADAISNENLNANSKEDSAYKGNDLIKSIDQTSEALNKYIAELDDTNDAANEGNEMFGIIENQNKQIELLEFLRNKEFEQTQKLNNAIKQLEKLAQSQHEALDKKRQEVEKLAKKITELAEQVAFGRNQTIEFKENLLIAEQNAKASQDEHRAIAAEFQALQEKYTQMAKRSLEQQNQNQERIKLLESDLKIMTAEMNKLRSEKNNMVQEIEANNRLVILQDEMITALSMDENKAPKA